MTTAELNRHLRYLLELENENQHSEYLVYYAEHLARDRRLAKAAEAVVTLHRYFGEMPRALGEVRDRLREGVQHVFKARDPEGYRYTRSRGV